MGTICTGAGNRLCYLHLSWQYLLVTDGIHYKRHVASMSIKVSDVPLYYTFYMLGLAHSTFTVYNIYTSTLNRPIYKPYTFSNQLKSFLCDQMGEFWLVLSAWLTYKSYKLWRYHTSFES